MKKNSKIVVIGGTGLIGTKLVNILRQQGHEVVAASPSSGVNTLTGEGVAEAVAGAEVVVDVANSPTFDDKPAMDFFETSGRNLLAAEKTAGVKHHVALSVVGTDRLTGSGAGSLSGYFRAKMAQENLIKASGIPYTIVHATQFFEFVKGIAQSGADGSTVRLSSVLMQPMAADDVAAAVAEAALGQPANGMIEVAGPDKIRQDELVRRYLSATGDARKVTADDKPLYFGIEVDDQSLVPSDNARIGRTRFDEWLSRAMPQKPAKEASSTASPARPASQNVAHAVRLLLCGFAALCVSTGSAEATENRKVTVVSDHVLPNVPGKSLKALVVEYGPGGSSVSHTHPPSAFIYATVLEGAIRSQVNDDPVKVYRVGESWTEKPGDHHRVSANASQTESARLLAVFVVDTAEKNLVRDDPK